MAPPGDLDLLRRLQEEIEAFLKSLEHAVVVENESEVFDLTAARWRLTVEFGKLIFEAWNPSRSVVRRVEEIAYRDQGRMGIFVRTRGGRATSTLEFRELRRTSRPARAGSRASFRQEFLSALGREYPGWHFERVSHRSDREHSFSAWYTRGWARKGQTAWAFLGSGENEPAAAADAALVFALIWLDWLRSRSERVTVSGLKLFLPRAAVEVTAHRAAYLNRRVLQLEIFAWSPGQGRPAQVDLKDFGNVETHLVPRRQGEALAERHREMLHDLLGDFFERVEIAPEASESVLSLRVLGLEVARIEGQLAPRIFFGLEGNTRRLGQTTQAEFRELFTRVLALRQAGSEDPSDEFYRLQAERWLESLLVRDITKIDPALLPDCVYPQVPAFAGRDRGVIDILSMTRNGRLAVIELKLHEEINLPLQGLDYWIRVKWLQERGQFEKFGYFPGRALIDAPPLLYLVSPAFRFHSTTDTVVRYLDPSIEIIQVGLNEQWREGIKVLFRREKRRMPEPFGFGAPIDTDG